MAVSETTSNHGYRKDILQPSTSSYCLGAPLFDPLLEINHDGSISVAVVRGYSHLAILNKKVKILRPVYSGEREPFRLHAVLHTAPWGGATNHDFLHGESVAFGRSHDGDPICKNPDISKVKGVRL